MSDLTRAIAFAYRRKGVETMPGGQLRLLLAYDLRWFAPEDAKLLVARAVEAGLVTQEGDELRVAFDPAAVDIPVNFRPERSVLDEPLPEAPPAAPPRAAAPAPPAPEPAASTTATVPASAPAAPDPLVEEERKRRGGLVTREVAALVVARRSGEDVKARLPEAEARLLRGA